MAVHRAGDPSEPAALTSTPAPPEGLTSRERILWAAATMLGEGPGSALSVRVVAERAQVSTGSLRHHFPTQRSLMDAMLRVVYDLVVPSGRFDDASVPPRDRLLGVLQSLLAPQGGSAGRDAWLVVHERYIAVEPTQALRAEYQAMQREVGRRVEDHLEVLVDEGALTPGDTARRARFLLTVLNGVSIEQALPGGEERLAAGLESLGAAVDCVLDGRV